MSTIPDVHSLPIYTLFRGSTDIKDNFKVYPLSADGDEMQAFVPGPAGGSKRTDLAKPARIIAQTANASSPSASATSEMLQAAKPTLTANLRGRTLLGTRVDLPTGYTGAVMLLGSAAATAQETIATSIVEAASSSSVGGAAPGVSTLGAKRPRDDDDMFDCDLSDAFFKAAAAAPVAATATTAAPTPSTPATIVGQHYPSIPGVTFDTTTIPHSKDPQAVFQVTNLNTSTNSVEKLEKAAKARIMMLPTAHPTPTEQHDAVFHTFPSYVVWEHDYPATFTDTKGPMLWLELASELHASD